MKETTKTLYQERMLNVLTHIQSHLDDELSLESLAAKTYFSPIHFHRIFKGAIGETVVEHIRRIRLERAAARLAGGESNVTNAAFDSGYETVESFSRAFKKMFGCPPSKYQEQHWEKLYEQIPGTVHYLPENARDGLTYYLEGNSDMEIEVKTCTPLRVAFIRHIGPYHECKPAWNKLYAWAWAKRLLNDASNYIGICHDDPQITPEDKIRYDACITVDGSIEAEGEIGIQMIEGGEYAVTLHKGPHERIENTYAELMGEWLLASGRELRELPAFEVYKNSPDEVSQEELLTEIYLPLK